MEGTSRSRQPQQANFVPNAADFPPLPVLVNNNKIMQSAPPPSFPEVWTVGRTGSPPFQYGHLAQFLKTRGSYLSPKMIELFRQIRLFYEYKILSEVNLLDLKQRIEKNLQYYYNVQNNLFFNFHPPASEVRAKLVCDMLKRMYEIQNMSDKYDKMAFEYKTSIGQLYYDFLVAAGDRTNIKSVQQMAMQKSFYKEVYCYCDQQRVTKLIMCQSITCLIVWYHLDCVGLKKIPEEQWYCANCRL